MRTAGGTSPALLTGSLEQWKKEKWTCRSQSNDTYILTRGNGAQHAIVVLGNGHGLNLEDLAAGQSNMDACANGFTRSAVFLLCILWVFLLVTAAGLRDDTWFLLIVGGLGIIHNVFVAGCRRRPENFGLHLDFIKAFGRTKVMATLFELEEHYPRLGRSMRDEFFPENCGIQKS